MVNGRLNPALISKGCLGSVFVARTGASPYILVDQNLFGAHCSLTDSVRVSMDFFVERWSVFVLVVATSVGHGCSNSSSNL